jgi:hypothetical protein
MLAIRVEKELSDAIDVAFKRVEKLARLQIPHLDGVVPTT